MAESRNRSFAKLAKDVDTSGNIVATGISSSVSLGATIYASRANLPSSGNTAGDQAYVTDNNRLYIWNGSGWYNIALLNVAPAISSVTDSDGGTSPFSLARDGTATTITITAADSDGDPITYTATADSNFAGLATLSQADNVFTITPFSQDSATTTSGTITFTATDGVNIASSGVQTFTLTFPLLTSDWSSAAAISYTDTTLSATVSGSYGHTFRSAQIIGNYLYVTVRDSTAGSAYLEIFDISSGTPSLHTTIGGVSSNIVWSYLYGMKLIGTRLYVAGHNAGIIGIDVSDPANPTIHRQDYYTTGGLAGGYGAFYYPYVDVTTEDIYYRKTSNILLKSSLSDWWNNGGYWTETQVLTSFSSYSGDISPDGSLLAAYDNVTNTVKVVTLSNNTVVSQINIGGTDLGSGHFFFDNTTLVTMGTSNTVGFRVYDLSNPASPTSIHQNVSIGRIGGGTASWIYDQAGNRLAIGISNYGLNIWDTTNGISNPSLFGTQTKWHDYGYGLSAKNGYTYGVNGTNLRTWYN